MSRELQVATMTELDGDVCRNVPRTVFCYTEPYEAHGVLYLATRRSWINSRSAVSSRKNGYGRSIT